MEVDYDGKAASILGHIAANEKTLPNLDWCENFILSKAEAEMLADPKWIFPNLIISGHVAAYPAAPNAGKTTIFSYIAGEIAKNYQVFYVNADVSGGDAKRMVIDADNKGYTLLLPDMKAGLSMDDVVKHIEGMNRQNTDYSGYVFIFDTLKKMTDVINKSRAKGLFKTLRGLSAKGMTIILLCHTNKYPDSEGMPIYEGTGDLRSDVDELIYLVSKKHDDGSLTVSTIPDKVRGSFTPITFEISENRFVTLGDQYVDIILANKNESQIEKDSLIIEAITAAIKADKFKQSEITEYCKATCSIGWRQLTNVLTRYASSPNQLWTKEKAFQNNAWQYFLVEKHSPNSSGESEK